MAARDRFARTERAANRLPAFGKGVDASQSCSKRFSNAFANDASWTITTSLSCCFRPEADKLAEPVRNAKFPVIFPVSRAPEVECIAKGKARTRYEFGVKVSIAVTNARADGGQFVVGIRAVPGLPYDGHTLKDQIAQVERLTGVAVTRAYVDKGYRGQRHSDRPTSMCRKARPNERRR